MAELVRYGQNAYVIDRTALTQGPIKAFGHESHPAHDSLTTSRAIGTSFRRGGGDFVALRDER
ncbi:MAG: hypothetical protein ACYC1I_07285 [Acidimicrobiales bacterium]